MIENEENLINHQEMMNCHQYEYSQNFANNTLQPNIQLSI
jgi:hypothetical protein